MPMWIVIALDFLMITVTVTKKDVWCPFHRTKMKYFPVCLLYILSKMNIDTTLLIQVTDVVLGKEPASFKFKGCIGPEHRNDG